MKETADCGLMGRLNDFMDYIQMIWQNLSAINISDVVDIAVVSFLIYQVVKLVRETSSARIIRGVIILIAAMWISNILQLTMVNYLFRAVLTWGIVVIAIVFQPELRRILERMGRSKLSSLMLRNDMVPMEEQAILEIVHACSEMSWSRTGALIIFERDNRLDDQIRTGTILDAETTAELLKNIFYPKAPLHDGAAIIRRGRIQAAGCMLPLSNNPNLSKELGMRHRAGIGMSEASDAVVVIVSEETGSISVAVNGMLKRHLTKDTFEKILRNELIPEVKEEPTGARWFLRWKEKDNADE